MKSKIFFFGQFGAPRLGGCAVVLLVSLLYLYADARADSITIEGAEELSPAMREKLEQDLKSKLGDAVRGPRSGNTDQLAMNAWGRSTTEANREIYGKLFSMFIAKLGSIDKMENEEVLFMELNFGTGSVSKGNSNIVVRDNGQRVPWIQWFRMEQDGSIALKASIITTKSISQKKDGIITKQVETTIEEFKFSDNDWRSVETRTLPVGERKRSYFAPVLVPQPSPDTQPSNP